MTSAVTLADISLQGSVPAPHEAVAIVLSLMENALLPRAGIDDAAPPTPSTITVSADGHVSCSHAFGVLGAPGIATLLQQILADTRSVPPGLLFCIARALGAVEAPPFESPEAFLRALGRFERGDRHEVVAAFAARAGVDDEDDGAPARNRRRMPSLVTQLRQELRAVDRRGYEEDAERRSPIPARAHARKMIASRVLPVACAAALLAAVATSLASDSTSLDVPSVRAPRLEIADTPTISARTLRAADIAIAFPVAAPAHVSHARSGAPHKSASRAAAARKSSKLKSVLTFQWLKHFITVKNDL